MPRWPDTDDEWDHDPDSEEEPGEDDLPSDEDEEPTYPCPYCSREIHEDAQRCPFCGSYISREDAPPARKPWWIVFGVILCLYIVFRWIFWF